MEEIPDQVVGYFTSKGFFPSPANAIQMGDPLAPVAPVAPVAQTVNSGNVEITKYKS